VVSQAPDLHRCENDITLFDCPSDNVTCWHHTEQYANNRVEADHGRLKARLRPLRGLKQDRSARVVIADHALVQNVRRGHYELAVEAPVTRRVAVTFDELALVI
jgi:transposase-like protein